MFLVSKPYKSVQDCAKITSMRYRSLCVWKCCLNRLCLRTNINLIYCAKLVYERVIYYLSIYGKSCQMTKNDQPTTTSLQVIGSHAREVNYYSYYKYVSHSFSSYSILIIVWSYHGKRAGCQQSPSSFWYLLGLQELAFHYSTLHVVEFWRHQQMILCQPKEKKRSFGQNGHMVPPWWKPRKETHIKLMGTSPLPTVGSNVTNCPCTSNTCLMVMQIILQGAFHLSWTRYFHF